ncbi:MAG: hypothetical protein QOE28_274, partial [Solirubrobacteraceae bacterium]|nr:hypothetical protein [Solirubrobacteraceae bacterium]
RVGCLLFLFALISPRLALILVAIFSNLLSHAYHGILIPLIGFFVLPWTTLAYAWMWRSGHHVRGIEWLVVLVALLVDLGAIGGGGRERRRRGRRAAY